MTLNKYEDELGESCKALEKVETHRMLKPGLPILARLDGRAFHSFCRNLKRPFDPRLTTCMVETARALLDEFNPSFAYTQSDEISLFWDGSYLPFGGRSQKLISVMAGFASSFFARQALELLPEKKELIPCFDCRVWNVESFKDGIAVLEWREHDCVKNSVSMAAQSVFSHTQLLKINTVTKISMLATKGINWFDYPHSFKFGTHLKRVSVMKEIDAETMAKIPESKRPPNGTLIRRTEIHELPIASITTEEQKEAIVFGRASIDSPYTTNVIFTLPEKPVE